MNLQTALSASQQALSSSNVIPDPNHYEYSIYLNFTTKALTLWKKQIDYPVVGNIPYIRAKDGNAKNDFWIVGFKNFYEAFTVLIVLNELLRCRFGTIFALSVHNSAKPTNTFPF